MGKGMVGFFTKVRGLFVAKPKLSICGLKATGDPRLLKAGKVFGKKGNPIASVSYYTQPCDTIVSGGAPRATSILSRDYVPAEGTRLARMGVQKVTTTRTPFGTGLQAEVNCNGKIKIFNHDMLKNYVGLMKV